MKLYDIKGKDVAARVGLDKRTVWVVLGGFGTSARIEKAITRMIQKHDPAISHEDLWPKPKTNDHVA